VQELRCQFAFKELLKLAKLPRSTYYYYNSHKAVDKYAGVKEQILEIHTVNKSRYGYRRITSCLRINGIVINHKTVLKLMNELKIYGKQRRSKYKSYKGEIGKVADNILNRNFIATKPYEKLVTDVTEFAVCDDKTYLSPVMDLYNREIVSYSISYNPNLFQMRDMMQGLVNSLPNGVAPLLHSDQGWQYQHEEFQRVLHQNNIKQSMSRKGNCLDNSPMENFFGRLKVEMFYGEHFTSIEEFKVKLIEYINYHNNDRISLKLKGLSPVQYRTQLQTN
jgi:Transposase and inactivated derivatives